MAHFVAAVSVPGQGWTPSMTRPRMVGRIQFSVSFLKKKSLFTGHRNMKERKPNSVRLSDCERAEQADVVNTSRSVTAGLIQPPESESPLYLESALDRVLLSQFRKKMAQARGDTHLLRCNAVVEQVRSIPAPGLHTPTLLVTLLLTSVPL